MLEIRNLHATVEGRETLNVIDLTIRSSEVHAIMAKTMLANVRPGDRQ